MLIWLYYNLAIFIPAWRRVVSYSFVRQFIYMSPLYVVNAYPRRGVLCSVRLLSPCFWLRRGCKTLKERTTIKRSLFVRDVRISESHAKDLKRESSGLGGYLINETGAICCTEINAGRHKVYTFVVNNNHIGIVRLLLNYSRVVVTRRESSLFSSAGAENLGAFFGDMGTARQANQDFVLITQHSSHTAQRVTRNRRVQSA